MSLKTYHCRLTYRYAPFCLTKGVDNGPQGKSQLRSYPTSKATQQTNMFLPTSSGNVYELENQLGLDSLLHKHRLTSASWNLLPKKFCCCYISNRNFRECFPLNSTKFWWRKKIQLQKPVPRLIKECEQGAFHIQNSSEREGCSFRYFIKFHKCHEEQMIPSLHGTYWKGHWLFLSVMSHPEVCYKAERKRKQLPRKTDKQHTYHNLPHYWPRSPSQVRARIKECGHSQHAS